ncbi:MAG: glycosyltransferase family 39 protein [Bacteroidales bacterium]|nr:glycosyltransferase family 39 protein [Bacteroidales bacterium]
MNSSRKIRRAMLILVLLSLVVRGFFAAFLEFGNDEVYYWTYALYPDLSHFDHPPMVGFLIQFTSLNLVFDSEFFIRLGAVLLGTFNIWLVFLIGRNIRDELTGFYAALLYTASIYAFIIAGTFILPDTPQLTFWLITVYFLIRSIAGPVNRIAKGYLLIAGLAAGFALLSKYTSVFLLAGAFLYVLIYNRKWFKTKELYLSAVMALIFFLPVFMWNYNNDFISFTFQTDRVGIFDAGFRGDFFFTELGGQMLYNNPVNFILGIFALVAFFRGKISMDAQKGKLMILIALPLIFLFLFFSLFRHTLPHWTGPAWTTIIFFSAVYLREAGIKRSGKKLLPSFVVTSLAVLMLVLILGVMQIRGGMLYTDPGNRPENIGERDISLDMYGWRQLSGEFEQIVEKEKELANIDPMSPVISHRWFPAANIDYYLARPLGIDVLGLGGLDGLHKYAWITQYREGFIPGMDAWYVTVSRDFKDPVPMYGPFFENVELAYTIPIYRNGKHVMNAFIYYLKDMKKMPLSILANK